MIRIVFFIFGLISCSDQTYEIAQRTGRQLVVYWPSLAPRGKRRKRDGAQSGPGSALALAPGSAILAICGWPATSNIPTRPMQARGILRQLIGAWCCRLRRVP